MTERIRVNRIELSQTLAGKPIVHLHAPGAQYARFPALYLFDPGLLIQVGIDPNSLEPGEDTHCNLWAHYEVSTKLNSQGKPYKDIISLERIDALATTTSTDTSAVLAELRAIKALLLDLVTDDDSTQRAERIRAVVNAGRAGRAGSEADPQTTTSPKPEPEMSEAEARTEFYTLTGPAVIAGTDPQAINKLTALANGDGWNTALAGLKALLAT